MEILQIEKTTAKKLYPEAPDWFKSILIETFGKKYFEKKKFNEINTFLDACAELDILQTDVFNEKDTTDEIAYKKLKIIAKAINQGWIPDWNNTDQKKWYPWFRMSSGFGFDFTYYDYAGANTGVGSRLCFETKEKAEYAGKQFEEIYKQLLTL